MYENDTKDDILLGWGLIIDGIICLKKGVDALINECPTEDGQFHLQRIKDMASDIARIERSYRSDLYDYERQTT